MAIHYVYVLAVWLRLELGIAEAELLAELREYLEAEYCVFKLEVVEDSESNKEGERTLSLQLQLTFEQSEMEEGEPTEAALRKLDEELRGHLEASYSVKHLEILDDALTSYLLAEEVVADERRYPEPRRRDLTNEEKALLRARIEQGDTDIYALAAAFGCSASQVAGIKAAMHR